MDNFWRERQDLDRTESEAARDDREAEDNYRSND